MKRRRLLYSFACCLMIVFSVACFKSLTVQEVEAAPDPIWDKEVVKHGCDILGEEGFVQEQITRYKFDLGYAPAESLMAAMNEGYLTAYVDTFKAYGMIPADFVPSSTATTTASNKTSTTTVKAPTLTEADAVEYVTVREIVPLDNYDGGKETGETLEADVEVVVNGYSSNGYYRVDSGAYVPKADVVLKDDYEAAWSVTEEIPATCTEAGTVKKTNSITGKEVEEAQEALGHDYALSDEVKATCTETGNAVYECKRCGDTYSEEYEALGHEVGDEVVTVEPGTFSKGVRTTYCSVCGAVISEEPIPQTFPLPLWGTILIAVAIVGGVAGGAIVIIKRKHK